ncbi:MAG: HEAT repeat domain-containing protein [Phycisphaerales bacterium]|nr:HEAT repeat domain-containing protein [Phycisphaerales bacterium]
MPKLWSEDAFGRDMRVAVVLPAENPMRTWRLGLVAVVTGVMVGSLMAQPPLPDPSISSLSDSDTSAIKAFVTYYANAMAAAKGSSDMVQDRTAVLKPVHDTSHPASAIFMDAYGNAINQTFSPLLGHSATALNAIITIAQVNDMSTQPALEQALTSTNASVRYWAAKGLGNILGQLSALPPAYRQAIHRLEAALAIEKDPVVKMGIADALSQASAPTAKSAALVVTALGAFASNYALVPPNNLPVCVGTIHALEAMLSKGAVLEPAVQEHAMQSLARIMSFTAQYYQAGLLNRTQALVAVDALRACGDAMDAISHSQKFSLTTLDAQTDKSQVLLTVNGLTGDTQEKGLLQELYPKVAAPVRISGKP